MPSSEDDNKIEGEGRECDNKEGGGTIEDEGDRKEDDKEEDDEEEDDVEEVEEKELNLTSKQRPLWPSNISEKGVFFFLRE